MSTGQRSRGPTHSMSKTSMMGISMCLVCCSALLHKLTSLFVVARAQEGLCFVLYQVAEARSIGREGRIGTLRQVGQQRILRCFNLSLNVILNSSSGSIILDHWCNCTLLRFHGLGGEAAA